MSIQEDIKTLRGLCAGTTGPNTGAVMRVIQAAESTLALSDALDVAEKALRRLRDDYDEMAYKPEEWPMLQEADNALTQISALRGKGG